ncbi:MAG: OsmC family peroxiredoxin [Gaiellales bacterium]
MPRIERAATASWAGSIARGTGSLSAPSGALEAVPYTFAGRTTPGQVTETNPEELLAAAHAGCFAMAIAAQLSRRDAPPEALAVTATVALDEVDGANRIVASSLAATVSASLTDADLAEAVAEADARCPFSALVRGAGGIVTVAVTRASAGAGR